VLPAGAAVAGPVAFEFPPVTPVGSLPARKIAFHFI